MNSSNKAAHAQSAWRVAKSLLTLRDQINELHPDRNKDWDGTIGDEAHQSRNSDHNPWVDGNVVTAMDITHDPAHGVDGNELSEALVKSRDKRIKYVIWNRHICNSHVDPWEWRPYTGSNPHDHHVHISVLPDQDLYDDTSPWGLTGSVMEQFNISKALQTLLNLHGGNLKVDGIVGPLTKLEYFKQTKEN